MNSPYGKRGLLLRLAYLGVATLAWMKSRLFRQRDQVIVLCYHGVNALQRARFAWQVQRAAPRAVSLDSLAGNTLRHASGPAVCFTFDDAFENIRTNALPILQEHAVPALVFAVSGNLGAAPRWRMSAGHPESHEPVMTADALRSVGKSAGITIGSHTVSHPRLTELPGVSLREELQRSRHDLENILGRAVLELAYPYGDGDERVFQAAMAAGYHRVYTSDEAPLLSVAELRRIGRFVMSPDVWPIEYLLTIDGAYAWLGPWRRWLRAFRSFFFRTTVDRRSEATAQA